MSEYFSKVNLMIVFIFCSFFLNNASNVIKCLNDIKYEVTLKHLYRF
jgi:hypothetical protein